MTRSKLERYLEILEVLAVRPLEFEIILYQVDENWEVVRKHLDFLVANGLVEKLPLGKGRAVYSVTDKGLRVLEAFREREYPELHEHFLAVYED